MLSAPKPSFKSLDEFSILNDKPDLGHGSYGVVKLAVHKKSSVLYALKIVDIKKLKGPFELDIIHREIKIHSSLDHTNIVQFFGSFTESDKIVIVLEYAEKGNLYSLLRRNGKLSEIEAFLYFSQTLRAIEYLHRRDILHRDIKPENLLLDAKNAIKLCDFGWSTEKIKLLRTTFCGTYEYMSPEVVFKRPYSENVDIWSLGILLYELLHGRSPFRARNLPEIRSRLKGPINLIFREGISEEVKETIRGILRLEATERLSLEAIRDGKWMRKMANIEGKMEKNTGKSLVDFQRKAAITSGFSSYEGIRGLADPAKANGIARAKNEVKLRKKRENSRNFIERTCNFSLESEERPFQALAKKPGIANENEPTLFSYKAMKTEEGSKENYANLGNLYIPRRCDLDPTEKRRIFDNTGNDKAMKSLVSLLSDFEEKLGINPKNPGIFIK